jgi:tetratricopeptide (TPR) repeat protein
MSRIDRLEDEVRYVLQSAAVIGRLFRHRLLQYTTQQEQHLDRYLWQLEDRDLVYEEHAIPELEYSFRHVLTQETAYSTILSRRRREFHRKVAEGYEALYSSRLEECYEELAYHYSRSDDWQKALDYLVKAGDKSRETFANDEAITYYNQALKLIDDAETEPTLLGHIYQSLGEIYFPLAKHEQALEYCHKALEYTTDKKRRARIYRTMGWVCERDYKQGLSLEYLNAGIAELGDDTECVEMAMIYVTLAYLNAFIGEPEDKIEIAQRGLRIVAGTEQYLETQELYVSLSTASAFMGNMDGAFGYARKSVDVAQKSGNVYLIAHSTEYLGWVHIQKGENDIAIRLMKEAEIIYKKIGHNFLLGHIYLYLWLIYQSMGNWDTAIECLEKLSGIPDHPSLPDLPRIFAWSYLQKGDAEKAIQHCEKVLEIYYSSRIVAETLDVLERAFAAMGKSEEFLPYCTRLKEEREEAFRELRLSQWYIEPKELSGLFSQTDFVDEFDGPDLGPEWEWVSLNRKSSYSLSSETSWLEIRAGAGSDLSVSYPRNFHAPRLLQKLSGDFALEVKLKPASDDLPSRGGLLIWKDKENYIRFERTIYVQGGISLSGRIQRKYSCFGRGILPSDILYLRLERIGDKFSACCSSDGMNWYVCGEVGLPVEDPIHIGIHAIGAIGLYSYTRLKGMDTATRFDYFRLLRRES